MDILTMAKFPYLKDTVEYIRNSGPSIEDLNISTIYLGVRMRGKERVLETLKESKITDRAAVTESEALQEILSYIIARILVSSVGNHFLIKRYALSEAKLMNERLMAEPVEFTLDLSGELGISASMDDSPGKFVKIDVTDFLRHSSNFKDEEWKLVNQDLQNGSVSIELRKFIRLLQHALQVKIESELPLPLSDDIKKAYIDELNEIKSLLGTLRQKYEVKDFGKLDLERLPPCMKHILAVVQAGENLPHSARFAITAFLHTIGLASDEILKIFGTSPDFDTSIARYQIDHITGDHSGTEYIPPGCGKMKSYGICYNPESLCQRDWMSHPLTYYRVKNKKKEEPKKKSKRKEKEKHAK